MFQQVCFSSISETSSFERDDLRKKQTNKQQTQEFLFQGPSYQSFLLPWGKVVSWRKKSNVPPTLFSAGSGVEVFSPFLGNLWKWEIISIIRIEEKSWNIQNIASEQLNQDKQKERKKPPRYCYSKTSSNQNVEFRNIEGAREVFSYRFGKII